jgi:CDP-diacylglycerol--glycerol-3-phosphate 3-phosphatidyltransferase
MPFNLPIFLTWLRVATIPLVVGIFYLPDSYLSFPEKNLWATIFFIGAAVTDWLDGYLARKWGQVSAFGAFLDPVADKLMVAAALLVLLNFDRVEAWVALVIIGREITISALREWMAQIGASRSVAVHFVGKLKTAAQMVAIPFLLYDNTLLDLFHTSVIGRPLIWIAAVLTVWSMFYYLQKAWPLIKAKTDL